MPPPSTCPSCGTKLAHEAESCPNCPWSWREEAPQQSALQSDGFRNKIMPVLIFAGIGIFIWKMGAFFFAQVEENNRQTAGEEARDRKAALAAHGVKGGQDPNEVARAIANGSQDDLDRVTKGAQAGVDAGRTASVGSPTATEAAQADEETGSGSISIVSDKAANPAPKRATEWKLRGVVYDLVSLKPVPGATLTLTDNQTNARAQTVTDSQGRYRIILPPLDGRGYLVAIAKPGYEKTYLNPGTEGVADMDQARREELARELATTISEPASLEPPSDAPFPTNFHLAPKR